MRITSQDSEYQDGLLGVTKITLTSPLVLDSSPTDPYHAAPKSYIDQETNKLAPLQHTHTFNVISDLPLGINLSVVNKVDGVTGDVQSDVNSKVSKSGDTLTGALYLPADPTQLKHLATKRFVDSENSNAVTSFGVGTVVEKIKKYKFYGYPGNGKPWVEQYDTNTCQKLDTWQQTYTKLNFSSELGQTVVINDRIYLISGKRLDGSISPTIYYSTIDSNGDISSFSQYGTSLPVGLYHFNAIIIKNKLYIIGGATSSTTVDTVYVSTISGNGFGAFTNTGVTLPSPSIEGSIIVTKNKLYMIGTCLNNGTPRTEIYESSIHASGDLGAFSVSSISLPNADYYTSCAVIRNNVYIFSGVFSDRVYKAVIGSDGNLSNFTLYASKLSVNTHKSKSIVTNNMVYLFGNSPGGNQTAQNIIQYAPVLENGELGNFSSVSNLPSAITNITGVCMTGKYIYLIAGNIGDAIGSMVYYSQLIGGGGTNNYSGLNSSPVNIDTVHELHTNGAWLRTDGSSVSKTRYSSLYGIIGDTNASYGTANPDTTNLFKLPTIESQSDNTAYFILS